MHKVLRLVRFVITSAWLTLLTMPLLPIARAQQDSGGRGIDELEQKIKEDILRQLEQRIKEDILQQLPQDIMKVLLQQNLLNRQIERGIDDYVRKQQEAQAMARQKEEQLANERAYQVRRVTVSRDHIYGNPKAPVSLIEYSDFECPFCKQFHTTPKEIVEQSGGNVNWVYRHFPLSMHNPGAQKEAEASECAGSLGGSNAFWKYANAIYARTQSNGKGFPPSQLVPLAKEIGLNGKRFKECVDSDRFASRVQEDIDEANKIGISATPTNVLLDNQGGQVILKSGALPSEAFKVDIEKMLGQESPAKNSALR
jgi:protein-disulfide isomerase